MSRLEIREVITEHPGITAREIAEIIDLNIHNVRRHLRKMEDRDTGEPFLYKHRNYIGCDYHYVIIR